MLGLEQKKAYLGEIQRLRYKNVGVNVLEITVKAAEGTITIQEIVDVLKRST